MMVGHFDQLSTIPHYTNLTPSPLTTECFKTSYHRDRGSQSDNGRHGFPRAPGRIALPAVPQGVGSPLRTNVGYADEPVWVPVLPVVGSRSASADASGQCPHHST